MSELPPVDVDVTEDGTIIVSIQTEWGRKSGSVSPDRATELAGQLGGAAEYARSLKDHDGNQG